MKKLLYTTLIGCAVTLFSACSSLQLVTFDRLQAADINFPEQIRSVGIVNYVPSVSRSDKQEDFLEGDDTYKHPPPVVKYDQRVTQRQGDRYGTQGLRSC